MIDFFYTGVGASVSEDTCENLWHQSHLDSLLPLWDFDILLSRMENRGGAVWLRVTKIMGPAVDQISKPLGSLKRSLTDPPFFPTT